MIRINLYYYFTPIILLLALLDVSAQIPPPNDLCQNAIELTYTGPECSVVDVDLEGATNSSINACFDSNEDVWYKITVPNETALLFKLSNAGYGESPSFSVFTGSCNNLVEYSCLGSPVTFNNSTGFILSDPELIGQTIYFRMYSMYYDYDDYDLCTQTIDFLDFNGTCYLSSEIMVNQFCLPDDVIIDTLKYVWSSDSYFENICYIMAPSLWYHVSIPAQTSISIQVEQLDGYSNGLSYETYSGSCNQLNFLDCGPLNNSFNLGRIVLHNFDDAPVLRIIKIGSEFEEDMGVISLCAAILNDVENDICETATDISFEIYPDCEAYPSIDFAAVADEGFYNDNYCYTQILDVWYTFDDGDTMDAFLLDLKSDSYNYSFIQYQLYNGSNCEELNFVTCGDIFLDYDQSEILIPLLEFPESKWFVRLGIDAYYYYPNLDICFSSFGPSENDECMGATLIEIDGDCVEFTTIGSTPSTENHCVNQADVWFKFIYDVEDVFTVITKALGQFSSNNFDVSFYRGDCNSLELVECNAGFILGTENQFGIRNPDLDGQMIYVAVSNSTINPQFSNFNFEICAFDVAAEPVNFAYCSIGKPLHLNQAGSCDSSYVLGFTTQTFYSGIGNFCHMEDVGFDAWTSFTVPENGKFSVEAEGSLILNSVDFSSISFYTGSCSHPQLISCVELNDNSFSENFFFESYAGQDINMQLLMESGGSAQFDLCVSESASPALINDNCFGAVPLSLSGANCMNPNLASNEGAHRSEIGVDCPGFSNDVWFTFVVPETGNLIIETKTVAGSEVIDGVFAIYSGTCDNLTLIACDDDSGIGNMPSFKIADTSLVNQELYLQFWAYSGLQEGDFEICLLELDEAVGDLCSEAVFVVAGSKDACYESNESEVPFFANNYSGESPDCTAEISSDIWFKFSYKEGERLVFEFKQSEGSSIFDGQAALYRSNCNALTFISCDDDSGAANMPSFDIEELIDPAWDFDQDFYVQFWDFNQGIGGNISYCLYDKDFVKVETIVTEAITILPNPFKDHLRIKLPLYTQGEVTWELVSPLGALVKSGKYQAVSSHQFHEIYVGDLLPSSYIISIKTKDQHWVKKILKQ